MVKAKRLVFTFFILLILLVISPTAYSLINVINVPLLSGVACTVFDEETSQNDSQPVGAASSDYYVTQLFWDPGSNETICKVDVHAFSKVNDPSAKSYTMDIWTLSGNNLSASQGTSDAVLGSDITVSAFNSFIFDPAVSVSSGTNYAITITMGEVDATNYLRTSINTSSPTLNGNFSFHDSSGIRQGNFSGIDNTWKIYTE